LVAGAGKNERTRRSGGVSNEFASRSSAGGQRGFAERLLWAGRRQVLGRASGGFELLVTVGIGAR